MAVHSRSLSELVRAVLPRVVLGKGLIFGLRAFVFDPLHVRC